MAAFLARAHSNQLAIVCVAVLFCISACGVSNRDFEGSGVAGTGGPAEAGPDRNTGGSGGSGGNAGSATTGGAGTTVSGSGGHAGVGGGVEQDASDGSRGGTAGTSDGGNGCASPNACGGCGTLSASIGAACGRCGKYVCNADKSDVTCEDSGLNACQGCGMLTQVPGASCGQCGKYTCNADNSAVTCVDPGQNACGGCGKIDVAPGTTCGSCGSYVCSADKSTTVCNGTNVNACGGCGTLASAPGATCGQCGKYVCSADKSSVSCSDPGKNACGGCGTLAASPNSACGQCGTYVCSADKSSVSCSDPGKNACGGCGTLAGAPGSSCGSCGSYACNANNTAVTCNDPGLNACGGCGTLAGAPAAACGTCGNYACSADKRSVACTGDTSKVMCSNNAPQQCSTSGQWLTGATCAGATPHCVNGTCYACASASDCPGPKANGCMRAVCTSNHTCDLANATAGTACPAGGTCGANGNCVRNPVTVDTYNIDATEVTVTQYAAFLAAKGNNTSGQPAYCSWNTSYVPTSDWPRTPEYGDMPVAWVDWCDAYAYCQWAGRRLCGKIGGGTNQLNDYANPSLSQWMHACSGPNNTPFPYGSVHDPVRCNGPEAQVNASLSVGQKTTCVGGYPGLYDMTGNVWEWEDSCTASSGKDDICRWRGDSFVGANDGPNGVFMQCDSNNNNSRSLTDSSAGFRCCSN